MMYCEDERVNVISKLYLCIIKVVVENQKSVMRYMQPEIKGGCTNKSRC